MNAKNSRFLVYLVTLFFFIFQSENCNSQNPSKPNFVLFLTDDIGWGDIGCYGNEVISTPNIDRLASQGLQFQNAYLTTSSCSPSRISIITGRYPHNTGAPELHNPIPKGQIMFPQLLKETGYYTVLSGKNHIGPQTKFAFDTIAKGKGAGGEEDWIALIKNRPKKEPFFFWFASHDAHRPWQVDEKNGIIKYNPDEIKVPPMMFNGPETRKDIAGYFHEISRADYYLGEIIKELEKQGILNNTYIIFMSDNGSPFPGNKTRLYDRGIKTPLIIYGPGIKEGTDNALVSAIDIAPTVLELAHIKNDIRIQGRSITPLLYNTASSVRDYVFAEHNWHVFQAHERMVRFGDWMYIRNAYPGIRNLAGESTKIFPAGKELWDAYYKNLTKPEQEDIFMVPRQAEELYNVKTDPWQFKNLANEKENQKILNYLRSILDTWIEETGDSIPDNPTLSREDIDGNSLPGKWKRGEKPGASKNATTINNPGPVMKKL